MFSKLLFYMYKTTVLVEKCRMIDIINILGNVHLIED